MPGRRSRARTAREWQRVLIVLFSISGLLLAGCGVRAPESGPSASPEAGPRLSPEANLQLLPELGRQNSPLATPEGAAGLSVLPTPDSMPSADRSSIELVLLHTNDNWGETEPCG